MVGRSKFSTEMNSARVVMVYLVYGAVSVSESANGFRTVLALVRRFEIIITSFQLRRMLALALPVSDSYEHMP